eukprot:13124244-Alexandrium_andersonii.AAC.1
MSSSATGNTAQQCDEHLNESLRRQLNMVSMWVEKMCRTVKDIDGVMDKLPRELRETSSFTRLGEDRGAIDAAGLSGH